MTRPTLTLKPGAPVPVPPQPGDEREIMAHWRGNLDKPLLSIVCLTFNHVLFIKDALNSFLMQKTDFRFEIFVHDDASTDGTIEILLDYKLRYPQLIRLHIQENNQYQKGLSALNFSLSNANGKYIAFCEGDDYWIDEHKIQNQACFLEDHPEVAIVYGDSIPFRNGRCLERALGGSRADLTQEQLKKATPIFTLTACFRNVLDTPIELSGAKYGDLTIWSRLGTFGPGKYMAEILPCMYRLHSGGIHSSSSAQRRRSMLLDTWFALYAYYKRVGDTELENYFFQKTFATMSEANGISQKLMPAMKYITKIAKRIKHLVH